MASREAWEGPGPYLLLTTLGHGAQRGGGDPATLVTFQHSLTGPVAKGPTGPYRAQYPYPMSLFWAV